MLYNSRGRIEGRGSMSIHSGRAEAIQFKGRTTRPGSRKGRGYTIPEAGKQDRIDDNTEREGRGYTIRGAGRRGMIAVNT